MCQAFSATEVSIFEYRVSGGTHILYRMIDGDQVNVKSVSSVGRVKIDPGDYELCPREINCGVIEYTNLIPLSAAASSVDDDATAQWFVDTDTNTYVWGIPDESTDPATWTYYDQPDGTLLATQPTNVQPIRTNSTTAQYSHTFTGAQVINSASLLALSGSASAVHAIDIDIRASDTGITLTRGATIDILYPEGTRHWVGDRTQDNLLYPATDFTLTLLATDSVVISWVVIL